MAFSIYKKVKAVEGGVKDMTVINTTAIVQIILAVFSLIQFIKIKKISGNILYCHEKKSFQDIYKTNAIWWWFNILCLYIAILFDYASKMPDVILSISDWVIVIGTKIIVIAMSITTVAISLYMATEIKHLSPNDGIGKQISNLESDSYKRKACRFYLTEAIVGLLFDFTLLIQTFYLHIIVGIAVLFLNIFFYYFGMADILQHENYNSLEYKAKYKKMKCIDKWFISNFINFFTNKDYHKKSASVLHENTSNIKEGVMYVFRNGKR